MSEFTQLPEFIARALVADTDCQVFLELRDESEEPSVKVSQVDNYQPGASDDYSKLYLVGDVFIAFELQGDVVSEVVAFNKDYLRGYVDTVFVDEPTRLVVTSAAEVEDFDSLVS